MMDTIVGETGEELRAQARRGFHRMDGRPCGDGASMPCRAGVVNRVSVSVLFGHQMWARARGTPPRCTRSTRRQPYGEDYQHKARSPDEYGSRSIAKAAGTVEGACSLRRLNAAEVKERPVSRGNHPEAHRDLKTPLFFTRFVARGKKRRQRIGKPCPREPHKVHHDRGAGPIVIRSGVRVYSGTQPARPETEGFGSAGELQPGHDLTDPKWRRHLYRADHQEFRTDHRQGTPRRVVKQGGQTELNAASA